MSSSRGARLARRAAHACTAARASTPRRVRLGRRVGARSRAALHAHRRRARRRVARAGGAPLALGMALLERAAAAALVPRRAVQRLGPRRASAARRRRERREAGALSSKRTSRRAPLARRLGRLPARRGGDERRGTCVSRPVTGTRCRSRVLVFCRSVVTACAARSPGLVSCTSPSATLHRKSPRVRVMNETVSVTSHSSQQLHLTETHGPAVPS